MHRTSVTVIVVLATLIGASCAGSPAGQHVAERREPVAVRTFAVEMTEVPTRFEVPGTVRAAVSTVVSSEVSGRIESLPITEGSRVRQNQFIAEIDSTDATVRLRAAEAALVEAMEAEKELERNIRAAEASVDITVSNRDIAQSTLDRYAVLRDRKSVSPQEFDEVQARLNSARAAVEQASQSLEALHAKRAQLQARIAQARAGVEAATVALADYRVTSPIDGIVTEKRAEGGMLASPGMPLVAIEDDSRYELEVAVEEGRITGITIGQPARVEIGALQQTLNGRVTRILPLGDPASRTYSVRIALPQSRDGRIRSGFFGRAGFEAGTEMVLRVPASAVVTRGELQGVYVVQDAVAVFRLVRIGARQDEHVEVLSGLKPGERVVEAFVEGLADGVPVVESRP